MGSIHLNAIYTKNLLYITKHPGYQKLMDSEIDTIPILQLIKIRVISYLWPTSFTYKNPEGIRTPSALHLHNCFIHYLGWKVFFSCSKRNIIWNLLSSSFLSIQFSSAKYIHIFVEPIPRILFILQNWNLYPLTISPLTSDFDNYRSIPVNSLWIWQLQAPHKNGIMHCLFLTGFFYSV